MANWPEAPDPQAWHKAFAVRANNAAWDLFEAEDRTAETDVALLTAALAALHHWGAVGTPLQVARAQLLAAAAHASAGQGALAVHLAEAAWASIQDKDPAPWERALSQAIRAFAAHANQDDAAHRTHWTAAETAYAEVPDGPDRDIVGRSLARVPRPR